MRDRLYNLIVDKENELVLNNSHFTDTYRIEQVVEHLLKNGVIVAPCKVGQDCYWITSYGIVPVVIDKILIGVGGEWKARARYFVKETAYFLFECFGETVFLTREEAERALREAQEK